MAVPATEGILRYGKMTCYLIQDRDSIPIILRMEGDQLRGWPAGFKLLPLSWPERHRH